MGHRVDMTRTCNRTEDGGLLAFAFKTFASDKRRTTVGKLNDDRCFCLGCSLKRGVDCVSVDAVDRRQRIAVLLRMGKNGLHLVAR